MATPNHYRTLGVKPTATADEIQQAYYALVRELFPEVNRGDEEAVARVKEVNRAYECLKDPEKRKEYDESLRVGGSPRPAAGSAPRAGATQASGRPAGGVPPPTGNPMADILGAMRETARRNAGAGAAAESGSGEGGPTVDIWLTPQEAIRGATKAIRVNGRVINLRIRIRQ